MLKVKFLLIVVIFFIFQGCCAMMGNCPDGNRTQLVIPSPPPVIKLGINVEEDKDGIQKFSFQPNGMYYYGKLLVNPTIQGGSIEGPEAQTLLDHIKRVFGTKKENFGVSIVPIIDGTTFPEIVLFNYSYDDSKTVPIWSSKINRHVSLPMVLLKQDTTLGFKFKYFSNDEQNYSKLVNYAQKFMKKGWIFTESSTIAVSAISEISSIISSSLSSIVTTEITESFIPVDEDSVKSRVFKVMTGDNKELASIAFSIKLSSSVVNGGMIPNNMTPNFLSSSDPLTTLKVSMNNPKTLKGDLDDSRLLVGFNALKTSNDFNQWCDNIRVKLDSYELNDFDSLIAYSNILRLKGIRTNNKFFNSECLSGGDLKSLKNMGRELTYSYDDRRRVTIDRDLVAGYMKSPIGNVGNESLLLNMFTLNRVQISANDTDLIGLEDLRGIDDFIGSSESREKVLERLSKIGVARVKHFSGDKLARNMLFRALNSKVIYQLTLFRETKNHPISRIQIKKANPDDISKTIYTALMKPAQSKVEGSESDVVLASI